MHLARGWPTAAGVVRLQNDHIGCRARGLTLCIATTIIVSKGARPASAAPHCQDQELDYQLFDGRHTVVFFAPDVRVCGRQHRASQAPRCGRHLVLARSGVLP